jgi:hypothetical protein
VQKQSHSITKLAKLEQPIYFKAAMTERCFGSLQLMKIYIKSYMKKSEIGKLLSFKFPKRKSNIQGVVLDYNDDWTLVERIHDYRIDGFTIFKNEKSKYKQDEYDRFSTKILKLKNYSHLNKSKVPIDSLDIILQHIDKKYKLIQLDTKDGEAFDVVKYMGSSKELYLFDALNTKAKWTYKLKLPAHEILYISFGNNYLNSLKLVTKFKSQHNTNTSFNKPLAKN